jgi:hypothetical protein
MLNVKANKAVLMVAGLILTLSAGATAARAENWRETEYEKRVRRDLSKTFEDGYREGHNRAFLLPQLEACGYTTLAWAFHGDEELSAQERSNLSFMNGYQTGLKAGGEELATAPSMCPKPAPAAPAQSKYEPKTERKRVRGFGSSRWD